jgi:hypothetical protein
MTIWHQVMLESYLEPRREAPSFQDQRKNDLEFREWVHKWADERMLFLDTTTRAPHR